VAESRRPPVRLLASILGMLLAFTACAPALRSADPPVAIPENFTASGQEAVPDRWWLAIEDPLLHDLIGRAVAGNFNLRIAWDRLHQAEAIARRSGADLMPALNAEAAVSRSYNSNDDDWRKNFSLGLLATYEVDLWGRIRSRRDAARLNVSASREDLQTAAITLSAQVASIWYQLVEQYGQQDLLAGQYIINEQVLELVTLRFRRGQTGAADVLQQQQLLQANQGLQAQVAARIAVLEHRLAILLGQPPGQAKLPRLAEPVEPPDLPETGIPGELIQRRPDLRRSHFRLLAADRNLAAAVAERFPRLSLTARISTGGDEVSDLFSNWLANLAANMVAPLVDGGFRRAEIARTRAVVAEELDNYGQAALEALGEVEDALKQELHQRQLIASLEEQLLLSRGVAERVRDRYLSGSESYLRVLDALLSQQGLERNRLTAYRQLMQYRIDLYRALAGGWEMQPPSGKASGS
jgi:NodT family efflux transporter outer membrane factor (OMF) lipoprotein